MPGVAVQGRTEEEEVRRNARVLTIYPRTRSNKESKGAGACAIKRREYQKYAAGNERVVLAFAERLNEIDKQHRMW